jgi:hypothetical protein
MTGHIHFPFRVAVLFAIPQRLKPRARDSSDGAVETAPYKA